MEQIDIIARFSIKENKLSEFKKTAREMIKAVRENEPGALAYNWYLDEMKMECIVLETYEDSQAVMAHVTNAGALLEKMSEFSDLTIEVLGNPNEEVSKLMTHMGVSAYPYFSGLS